MPNPGARQGGLRVSQGSELGTCRLSWMEPSELGSEELRRGEKGDARTPWIQGSVGRPQGIHFGFIVISTDEPQGTSTVRLGANQVGSPPDGLGRPRLRKRFPQRTVRRCST